MTNERNDPVLEAEDLAIGYGRDTIIADIRFELQSGKTLALVGSNGSGKTTLIKTIAGLLKPVSGSLRVFSEKPRTFPERVAYLGQFHPSAFILPLRVIDVVRMARFSTHGVLGRITAEDERFVREAMEIMGVLDLKDKPLNMLSGGQRQRVFIAQAFARHANLILLDEPTMNLDTTAREIYQKMIRDATAAGCSTVIATHDITEASECDMALLLARRVVAYGRGCEVLTPEVLLSTFGVIARYEEGRAVVYRGHGHECDDV